MPKQINSDYNEVRIPFAKMSFSPDVPSTALGPNEYNDGQNVESDVRGIRSVAGDQSILGTVPGTPTFITGGFRQSNEFWFIVATTEGRWWASNGAIDWYDITPGAPFAGYGQATNITEAWNGTVVFFNDSLNAPMFLPDEPDAVLVQYSNDIPVRDITTIAYLSPGVQRITVADAYASAPFTAGQKILISDVSNYFNGTFTVVASTTTTVDYSAVPGAAYPGGAVGTVGPAYTWNYNPNWKNYHANFMRIFATPNIGSILVAGNLTVTNLDDTETIFPVTVQWSQKFGLNQAPETWEPTVTNVAAQTEVPLRGPALDAFPCNGQFFLCSYWDTVVFSPLNYATTSAPILGVRLYNQGRGLLSSNCWANTDQNVYGVDARDVWVFDGTNFQGIGNQRVKNWFFDQLDRQYYDRVFMECNTQRNQIEIYYPDNDAVNGVPNKMLSYRYDLDIWNAPRDISSATMSCESPIWLNLGTEVSPVWQAQLGSRTLVYARGETNEKIVMKDTGFTWADGDSINSIFRRDNIKLLKDYSGKLMIHRLLPEVNNIGTVPFTEFDERVIMPSTGTIDIRVEGSESVGASPAQVTAVTVTLNSDNPWAQIGQNSHRVNTLIIENDSDVNAWICAAATLQFTQTEDDR